MTKAGLLALHRYAGLTMAALLLVQAVTGAMLAYRDELARLIDPAAVVSRPSPQAAPLHQIIASARQALPGFVVTRAFFPSRPDGVYFLELANSSGAQRYATVDPGNARVLRRGGLLRFPVQAALRLHYQLVVGPSGSFVIALNGCALLLMAVSGLAYWWPRQRLLRSLAIRRGLPLRLLLRQCHRTVGVCVALVLIVISSTGLVMAGQDALEGLAPAAGPSAAPLERVDQAVVLARAAVPGSALRDVRLSREAMRFNFDAPESGPRAVHQLQVELASMKVVKLVRARENPALWMKLLPVHTGEFAGQFGRFLSLAAGLLLAALAGSGPVLWWQRRRR